MSEQSESIDKAMRKIKEMKIDTHNVAMAKNTMPGKVGTKFPVMTNIYGINITKQVYVYVYDVRIFTQVGPTKTLEFVKKAKDDATVNDRSEKCVTILKEVYCQNKDVFANIHNYYYDGQGLLFSLAKICDDCKEFKVSAKNLPLADLQTLDTISVEIKASTSKPGFNLNSTILCKSTANLNPAENDNLLAQYMNIAINQYAIMHPERHKVYEKGTSFMTNPLKEELTKNDCKNVGDGKELGIGTKKSVRQIEGPSGRGSNNSCVVMDATKTAFHIAQSFLEKFNEVLPRCDPNRLLSENDRKKLTGVVKGLTVKTTHLEKNKCFAIFDIHKGNASNTFFEMDGNKVSIAQYFKKKYNMGLKFSGACLVLTKNREKMNFYPMEVLKVVPFQRVTIPQQTPKQSQQTTRECAVAPEVRQSYIEAGAKSLQILEAKPENLYLKNAGLEVIPRPMKTLARILPSPTIEFGNKKEVVDSGKWKTKGQRYLIPARIDIWAVYCVQNTDHGARQLKREDLQQFAQRFHGECKRVGMEIQIPKAWNLISESQLEQTVKDAASRNCKFLLFIVSDDLVNTHKDMKYFERKYEVITQQIKLSNVVKVMFEGKVQTLENIINKTNIKNGGLNYGLIDSSQMTGKDYFTPDRIILGISISHPPPAAAFSKEIPVPSSVGYSANMKSNPFEFIGDFVYQEAKKTDVLECIGDIALSVVKRHQEFHQGRPAKELVIYRNGIDEGAFALTLKYEIPLIRAVLKKNGFGNIKISFIVVAKLASDVRLFREQIDPNAKGPQKNIPPGVCVDTQLVHPSYFEFYLNSHTTLQGSAKTPRYTVLVDDLGMTADQIQGMTYVLAHNHQIVALTVSLPAPVYIANRYAERGQNLYDGQDNAGNRLYFVNSKMRNIRVNA